MDDRLVVFVWMTRPCNLFEMRSKTERRKTSSQRIVWGLGQLCRNRLDHLGHLSVLLSPLHHSEPCILASVLRRA